MVYPGFYALMHIHHHWGISHAGRGFSFIPVKKFGLYNSDLLPLRGDLLAPSGAKDFPGRSRWLAGSLTTQTTNKKYINCEKSIRVLFFEKNNKIWAFQSLTFRCVKWFNWKKTQTISQDNALTNLPQIIPLFTLWPYLAFAKMIKLLI